MSTTIALLAGAIPVGIVGLAEVRFALGKRVADRAWRESHVEKLRNVGSTSSLSVLPLVDWFPSRPGLVGEAGVAYLIETDQNRILLDVGLNWKRAEPSPLLHNMRELGISLTSIDTVVISHLHVDHVGGLSWMRNRTFSLGNHQLDLLGKRVFVPEPMSYPEVDTVCTRDPTIIAPGVATIGTIRAQLYMGPIDEQALAIRLNGKGIVLVVACGHQSLPRIIERAKQLFDEPIHGVIGGLHYPFPRGRWLQLGLDLQRFVVYGPFGAPSMTDVSREIDRLAQEDPQWVSLSAHDSSDAMIERFRSVFGPRYHDLRIGAPQILAEAQNSHPALSA